MLLKGSLFITAVSAFATMGMFYKNAMEDKPWNWNPVNYGLPRDMTDLTELVDALTNNGGGHYFRPWDYSDGARDIKQYGVEY